MLRRHWQKLLVGIAILLTAALLLALMPACAPETAPTPAPTAPPAPTPTPTPTPAQPIKLLFGSWGPPKEPHSDSFELWAKDLEERSGGRVDVEISYGAALGAPPEYYDLALTGVADVAFFTPGWTPGRFPICELFTLPYTSPNITGEAGSKAFTELYKRGYLDEELSEVEVMYVFTTSTYHFLWAKDSVTQLKDFKGKKIRVPSGAKTEAVKLLGGVPVSQPATETYLILQKGIVDGNFCPWSMLKSFKLQEVTKYMTETSISLEGFGVVMNKAYWDKLPTDIQDIIKDMRDSGKYSLNAGMGHDQWDKDAQKLFTDAGGTIQHLSSADQQELLKLMGPVFTKFVADYEAKGVDVKPALKELYNVFEELGVKNPFDLSLIE